MQRTSLCCLICFLFTLFWSLHFTVACKYLQAIQILETNALQKSTSPTYTPVQIGIAQDVSINLTQLFQTELSISVEEARHTLIFFTDASESRPFVIRQGKDGSRILTNELPIDREEICDPYKFPHHAAVSRRCCARKSSQQMKATAAAVAEDEEEAEEEAEERVENHTENSLNPPRLNFRCCVFLGITVEGYGTFALRIDVVDVNDNPPRFHLSPDFTLGHGGKETPAVLKIVENTVQGTIISLPQAFDLDEGKNAELLFRVEKMSPMATWERHFKLLSGSEDRCITNTLTDIQLRDVTFPALCLLSTIDRETTPTAGFTFDLIARDQGEPVALSTTLSMSIVAPPYPLLLLLPPPPAYFKHKTQPSSESRLAGRIKQRRREEEKIELGLVGGRTDWFM
ncbi:unnamed protein product [Hydatigera taeniaeformis]|uniref:Cadherin domain-containing protein n=1 Tax=Hydatigena taeniaeformis TaxID=6205 RepID=A0A0R3XCM9_HYDTA|nr:unnamed protein product [Hydatigera taeniaeformis]